MSQRKQPQRLSGLTPQPRRPRGLHWLLLLSLVGSNGLIPGVVAKPATRQTSGQAVKNASLTEPVTLNFVNAEIDAVIRAVGAILNKNFVVDPRVKGQLTLVSPKPVMPREAYDILLSALRVQGFTIVEANGLGRVVPEADAKLQAGPVESIQAGESGGQRGDQIITQVFRLNYESANGLVPVLRPLIPPNNTITAYPNNNTLVITDYAENLKRIARIIASLDAPSTNEVEAIPLKHALAVDIATTLNRLLDDSQRGATVEASQRITVLADTRSNSVLLRSASPTRLAQAKSLLSRLDQPLARPGNIWVVPLKNAEATRLAQTLRAVLSGESSASGLGAGNSMNALGGNALSANQSASLTTPTGNTGGAAGTANTLGAGASSSFGNSSLPTVQGGGMVQADPATNTLIITAPEPIYNNLRNIIEKLDVRRAQVFVESLIVEVTAQQAAEFGIQWQDLSGINNGNVQAIGGTNFTDRGSGSNIIDVATNVGTAGRGLNIGFVKGQISLPGLGTITNLGALARALESNSKANILSTPNILTLDNEEAKIVIGQNVPFVTGQFTNTGGTGGAVNPFQTIERRDVGLTLRVKPQVSEGGTVRMALYQEVSSVQSNAGTAGVVTNKRAIESNVLVDDGQIIVIGGLVQDDVRDGVGKVPLLGDIPVLGSLFRYDTRSRGKTNLMVFLRPYIIRNSEGVNNLVTDRYDYMRTEQMNTKPGRNILLPEYNVPILQELKLKTAPVLRSAEPALTPQADSATPPNAVPAPAQP
ncbi:type II secretion system secretin GspD [Parvibium lacunae]|uniref:Type II secretion system protein GspD n=1 Tax=Parvibium lacunae TaxID=1888893 RepID=A0A368L123_9BURK|nr:type II secretion system secretin GspD [Parvibium lacunae]RCS56809.1 type II secretion system protein GspD [Parvibium lacunae]